jgi:hypothetical protein
MIWGIFLGTAVMAFSVFLVTAVQVVRLIKKKSDEKAMREAIELADPEGKPLNWCRIRPA